MFTFRQLSISLYMSVWLRNAANLVPCIDQIIDLLTTFYYKMSKKFKPNITKKPHSQVIRSTDTNVKYM